MSRCDADGVFVLDSSIALTTSTLSPRATHNTIVLPDNDLTKICTPDAATHSGVGEGEDAENEANAGVDADANADTDVDANKDASARAHAGREERQDRQDR